MELTPGFEPGFGDSESPVLTTTLCEHFDACTLRRVLYRVSEPDARLGLSAQARVRQRSNFSDFRGNASGFVDASAAHGFAGVARDDQCGDCTRRNSTAATAVGLAGHLDGGNGRLVGYRQDGTLLTRHICAAATRSSTARAPMAGGSHARANPGHSPASDPPAVPAPTPAPVASGRSGGERVRRRRRFTSGPEPCADQPGSTRQRTGSETTGSPGQQPTNSKGESPSLVPQSPADQDAHLHEYELLYDRLFERIKHQLRYDPAVATPENRSKLGLQERRGLLWQKHRLYVPSGDNLRNDLLYWYHDVPWCAHLGIRKTVEMVTREFFWPRMHEDIATYVRTCTSCQMNKTDRINRRPPLSPLVPPSSCWRTLGVDLITELPESRLGHTAIAVFVCHLSKMVRLVPTVNELDAEGFAKMFVTEVFVHYGFPVRIVSDRGTQWNNDFFKSVCSALSIQLRMSTAHHAQTNGLVERTNEPVEAAIRHYVSPDLEDWDDHLPYIEFALNSSYHDALGATPFQMNRIAVPLNPFEALLQSQGEADSVTHPQARETTSWVGAGKLGAGSRTVIQAHEQFQHARRCVHLAKERMKLQQSSSHMPTCTPRVIKYGFILGISP